MAADPWPPYNFAVGEKQKGFLVDIAEAVFAQHGFEIKYINIPWTRAKRDCEDGLIDAVVGTSHADGPRFIFPKEEQGLSHFHVFTKKAHPWKYTGPESILQVRTGIALGYGYEPALDTVIEKHVGHPNLCVAAGEFPLKDNMHKLKAGLIDAFLDDKIVFTHMAQTGILSISDYNMQPVSQPDFTYIAFSPSPKKPDSKKYADIMGKGTEELRASGELARILAKYGLVDWK